ncbi:hypothetical protein Sjap_004916 [Stephania japonica]|uniref:Uncharacterized protein n=1 Tax=Stephania japonica TaxID=461633 RepID=A0AAP0PHE9_9MAGN
MEGWGKVLEEGELEVVRNAGIVLLQREIPDYVIFKLLSDLDICSHMSRGVSNGFNNSYTNIAREAPTSSPLTRQNPQLRLRRRLLLAFHL